MNEKCVTCKDATNIPYIVYESSMSRADRIIKRLIAAVIVAILLIFASNGIWIWYISGFDVETYEYDLSTEGGGDANFVGQDGDIYNGAVESSS